MSNIPLTQGKVAIVDAQDFPLISRYKWFAIRDKRYPDRWYARTHIDHNLTAMHRFLMRADTKQKVDHVNGNGLDNRRKNIRLCDSIRNGQNRSTQKHSSKFKGVTWYRWLSKWVCHIRVNKQLIHLGYFKSEIDAGIAYNKAAVKYFGEFARVNEIA